MFVAVCGSFLLNLFFNSSDFMPKLVCFRDAADGCEVWVNPDLVCGIREAQGCSVVLLAGGGQVVVTAPVPVVAAALDADCYEVDVAALAADAAEVAEDEQSDEASLSPVADAEQSDETSLLPEPLPPPKAKASPSPAKGPKGKVK